MWSHDGAIEVAPQLQNRNMWSHDGAIEVTPQLRNKPRSRFEVAAKSVHKRNVLV